MIVCKNAKKAADLKLSINFNLIKKSDYVKYLGVIVDNKLSWTHHIDALKLKLSKACGIIYKLRYYVPLSTLKLVYYSMFQSHLQYSLLNWGRACKSNLHKLEVLQNKIIRACLFCPLQYHTNLLYCRFNVLKLKDMINMEIAKFMFKFNNNMLPSSFDNYFTRLDEVHNYNTRQKMRNEYFQTYIGSENGKKTLHHISLSVWKCIPQDKRHCSFPKFKQYLKANTLDKYKAST